MKKIISQIFKVTLAQSKRCSLLIFALASVVMAYAGSSYKVTCSSNPTAAGTVYMEKAVDSKDLSNITGWTTSKQYTLDESSDDKTFSGTSYAYCKANLGYTFTEWSGTHMLNNYRTQNPHVNEYTGKKGEETLVANFVEIATTTDNEFLVYKTSSSTLSSDQIEIVLSKTKGLDIACSSNVFTVTSNAETVLDGTTKQEVTITVTKNASYTGEIPDGIRIATVTLTPKNPDLDTYTYNASSITLYISVMPPPVVTFNPPADAARGSYTYQQVNVGGNAVPVNELTKVEVYGGGDDVMKLVATPTAGNRFKKWTVTETNEDGSTTTKYSYNATETFTFTKNTEVWAEFIDNRYARFVVKGEEGVFYDDMTEGLNAAAASSSKVLYVYQSGDLAAGNYTIPANVTLLIPGDDANTVCTGDVSNERDFIANTTTACKKYLTMEDNTTITVASKGAISIYAKMTYTQPYNGRPVTFGRLDMGNNCHIVVQSGAVLSALGYIIGDPTTSSVTIESGATVYECFQIRDWRGGTTALEVAGAKLSEVLQLLYKDFTIKGTDQKVFPVGQYYMQNIETKLILKAGSVEKLTTAASMNLSDYNVVMAANAPFVVPDDNNHPSGLVRLGTGTRFEKYYDREKDRQVFVIKGSAQGRETKFGIMSLTFPVKTISTHNLTVSSQYYVLPLTNNLDVTLDSVDITTSYDMALLGDASITINKNASFIIDGGARFFVSDKEESKHMWYGASAGNATINPVYYTPANSQYLLNASGGKISSKSDTVVKDANMYKTSAGNLYKRQVNDLTDYEGDYAMKDGRILVNGKIHVKNGYLYTTASGADITSDGGGKVLFDKVDHSTTNKYYRYLQAAQGDLAIGFHAIPVTNAKLHNDEKKNPEVPYSAGSEAFANAEYTYSKDLGMWLTPQELSIYDYNGNDFYITLPKDTIQNIICLVETDDKIDIDNFEITYPTGFFTRVDDKEAQYKNNELTIPIKYNPQNVHNKENPYTNEQLIIRCVDKASGTYYGQPTEITLSATEDYTPKFNVAINGANYTDGSEYPLITGTGVDDATILPVVITAENTNVAQALVTWNDKSSACTGPFTFEYNAKTDVPFANAELTYLPTAAGEHEGTLSLTATYKDASNEVQDTTVTIKLTAKVALKPNTLAFAQFRQPIYMTTSAFDLIDLATKNSDAPISVALDGIAVDISNTEPYLVTPSSVGVANITVTQSENRIYLGKEFSTTISVIDPNVYPVPFCVDGLSEFNKRLFSGKFVSYNTTDNVVEFNSNSSSSEWIFRFNGTPDKLMFTPTGNNAWNVQQRTSETDEWKSIATWTTLPSGERVSYQLEPTTSQVRIQYGNATPEIGTLSNVCVTELQIAADVEKIYIPIYANSEKKIVLTHVENAVPAITFTDKMAYTAEKSYNLGTASAPYYRTTITIKTTNNTEEETYQFTATENGHTVAVQVNAYNFPQELPIKLATDAPANGDRYYYVTTASSYAQWDAANRQIIFQNPGAQLTRMVTFAFNGAPSIIRFDASSIDGPEMIVDSVWTIEESADGIVYNTTTLPRDSVESNTLVQELKYTTRYVRVKYNSVHTQEVRLSNLVIEGYPNIIVKPENMVFTTSSTQQHLEAIAINLQNVDFVIDNTDAFLITADTTDSGNWSGKVSATPLTHETALGTNKVDTIFLGVQWLEHSALDEGTITIINKANDSILTIIPLVGSDDYLMKDNASNSGIYTGIPDGYTYHNAIYADYEHHPVDLTNAFAENGTALFDYLFIYGETTPASGTNITAPKKWTGDDNTSTGSNAVTPFYVYKKAPNADNKYMGYQYVGKVDNVNVGNKPVLTGVLEADSTGVIYFNAQNNDLRVYMTGFCPYATTGYDKLQEGVFLFRGSHGSKLDIYLEDFHVFSRNKTMTGHAFDGKNGGVDFSDGYARGSGGVLVFENVDLQQELQNYLPFEVTIHTMGHNLLKSNYGCFFDLQIANATVMKATQVSSPIQVHVLYRDGSDRYNERKTKTNLNFDDIWPVEVDDANKITRTKRTNGYLGLKKQANNAPSIDMGSKNTTVKFNGGQVELQNSQIGSDTYKTTLAISHRSGYFGSDDARAQFCYGIGTDSVGGSVEFHDGTITVERMKVAEAYRQYYLMDTLPDGTESEYTTCLRTPKNTIVRGGSICPVRACQHVTSKGGAPKDGTYGNLLGLYTYTMQDGVDSQDPVTKLAKIVGFPDNIEGLRLQQQNSGYTYGLMSVTPDANNQLYFWIPDGFGGVSAEKDVFTAVWKACMTEIGAGIKDVAEGRIGGDTPIELNEEIKYFLYCQLDKNIHDVISEGEGEGDEKQYHYQAPIEVPDAAKSLPFFNGADYTRWAPNYVSDSLQYQVLSDTTYTITDRVYYITTTTADIWQTFTAPFDVENIYVVEAYWEEKLEQVGTRAEILKEQAKHNADFAAFFAVAMAMGTDKSFDGIYQSYLEWAKIQDRDSLRFWNGQGDYTLRGMQELIPYYGSNWRDANFYLNVNNGKWVVSTNDFGFESKWEMLPDTAKEDGVLLHKGETYSLMFPYCTGCESSLNKRTYWDYWSGKFLIFESSPAPQTINGRDFLNETKVGNVFSAAPNANEVVVTGNSTFAYLDGINKDIYKYIPEFNYENFEHISSRNVLDKTIYPTAAFLYGDVPTSPSGAPARKVTRTGQIIYDKENTPTDVNPGGNIPTVGGGNDLFITSTVEGINIAVSEAQHVRVMSATGAIIYSGKVQTAVDVALPTTGVYVITGENEVHKILH